MKYLTLALTTLLYFPNAFAEADLNSTIYSATPSASSGAVKEAPVGTTTGRPIVAPGGSSINPAAGQGQQSQGGGAGANAMIGGAMMAAGAALMSNPETLPAGAALMAMGLLAMMQSKEDSEAAKKSAATRAASLTNSTDPGTNEVIDGKKGSSGFADAKIKEGKAKLKEAGYALTEKGLTHPNGKVTPAASFNSSGAMAAAGIDPAAIREAQKILAVNDSPFKVSSVEVNGGGGGGASSESKAASSDSYSSINPFAVSADQKRALVAGKTVLFDGEPIGVRGQNIFDMVHNCYQQKRVRNHFIEKETEVLTRSPASLPK